MPKRESQGSCWLGMMFHYNSWHVTERPRWLHRWVPPPGSSSIMLLTVCIHKRKALGMQDASVLKDCKMKLVSVLFCFLVCSLQLPEALGGALGINKFANTNLKQPWDKCVNCTGQSEAGVNLVDVSSLVSTSQITCLKSTGYNGMVVRVYRSIGVFDTNACTTFNNADSAGMDTYNYMYPCVTCGKSATEQVTELANGLSQCLSKPYGILFVDVEVNWTSNVASNQNFLNSLLFELSNQDFPHLGIYTNPTSWNSIMGANYTLPGDLLLWYYNWNKDPSFTDFKPFGGWTTPTLKQYDANLNVCGVQVDEDWSSSF